MKRFIWGIVIVVLAILSIIGNAGVEGREDGIGFAIFLLIGGGTLIYFGNQYKNRLKQATEYALQMIRDEGKIDARELAQQVGVSEVDVRGFIAESQRKGIIPFKTEII